MDVSVNLSIMLVLYRKICLIQDMSQNYLQPNEYVFNIPISLPKTCLFVIIIIIIINSFIDLYCANINPENFHLRITLLKKILKS